MLIIVLMVVIDMLFIYLHYQIKQNYEIVRDKLNLSQSEIYTIGDGTNDKDMIKKYNGLIIGNLFDEDKI